MWELLNVQLLNKITVSYWFTRIKIKSHQFKANERWIMNNEIILNTNAGELFCLKKIFWGGTKPNELNIS